MSNGSVATALGRVLITGGSGMLGRAWQQLLRQRCIEYAAPSHAELDITRPEAIHRYITGNYSVVVNCAAWTDVDGAEEHESEATTVNGTMVGTLAERCRQVNAMFVHYSTDYVFNGDTDMPYAIDQPRKPINAYGRSKAVGEQIVERAGGRYLLIRASWLYAPWGKNFVRTIARLVRERKLIRVVDGQRGRPSSCEHLARTSLALIEHHATGIYHVADGGECTWHEFACEIARHVNPNCEVVPCQDNEFPRLAKRPRYSVLDLNYIEAMLGPMPLWQENLANVLNRPEPDDD